VRQVKPFNANSANAANFAKKFAVGKLFYCLLNPAALNQDNQPVRP
jgi:hypothetical protein